MANTCLGEYFPFAVTVLTVNVMVPSPCSWATNLGELVNIKNPTNMVKKMPLPDCNMYLMVLTFEVEKVRLNP